MYIHLYPNKISWLNSLLIPKPILNPLGFFKVPHSSGSGDLTSPVADPSSASAFGSGALLERREENVHQQSWKFLDETYV